MSNPNCEEFLRQLNELFSSDEAIEEHPHYTTCVQCRSLIRDIKLIIENAPLREPDEFVARLLPVPAVGNGIGGTNGGRQQGTQQP